MSAPKIDWDNIKVSIVKADKPNPMNPYSALSLEERQEQLQSLYQRICLRMLDKELENNGLG